MTDEHQHLETRLAELASQIDWPAGDLTQPVRHRITTRHLAPPSAVSRRLKIAAAAAAAIVVVLVVPTGRQAVADLLGVAGIELTFGDRGPSPTDTPFDLGTEVSLVTAARSIEFDLTVPSLAELGPPDGVYLQEDTTGAVNLVWYSSTNPAVVPIPGTDIGLLVTQFTASATETVLSKELTSYTDVDMVTVAGQQALWIEGAPHRLSYQSTQGTGSVEVSRLAGNVLLWEDGDVTYRIESSLDLEAATRIAESLTPATPR